MASLALDGSMRARCVCMPNAVFEVADDALSSGLGSSAWQHSARLIVTNECMHLPTGIQTISDRMKQTHARVAKTEANAWLANASNAVMAGIEVATMIDAMRAGRRELGNSAFASVEPCPAPIARPTVAGSSVTSTSAPARRAMAPPMTPSASVNSSCLITNTRSGSMQPLLSMRPSLLVTLSTSEEISVLLSRRADSEASSKPMSPSDAA
mmetsp:Transcript_1248/g.3508  ORF Transcript_1248/g.3508 Transcript_1248/m.3508 type:complete len:211 (+) Transcript_1248:627-1259(+)